MIWVITICALSCAGMIAVTLLKPKLKIRKLSLGTYWMITLLGAVILISAQFIGLGDIWEGLTAHSAINPIKILILFISMTVLSIFLDETGFFKYLANKVLKKANSGQIKLFTAFFITIALVTIFTSNDIVILTFMPFLCYFAKNAKVDPIPYVISGFVAANTCSMLLIIGNPTNIYLATSAGINFIEYLKMMALPTILATVTAYFVMLILFYKKLKKPISGTSEDLKIAQKPLLFISLVLLGAATIMLAISSYIEIEMWLIAIVAAGALILLVLLLAVIKHQKPIELGNTLKRTPWELIPFVISMFVLVLTLGKYSVTTKMGDFFGANYPILIYGIMSLVFANLVNNIPMSVLFTSILVGVDSTVATSGIYAAIIGSNIGAFLTPIGALAGIMWLSILKNNNIDFSFGKFIRYGIIITIPVLASALFGLYVMTLIL